ncbi:MAG: ATP-binding cassette domain-containing protein, partial [Gammaproteobacteria bacterium]|nr:ATP-binding cassette domain-containing protein [Gammaproteobacteria bacterium]
MSERLLTVKNLQIEGFADDTWKPIVNGIDLHLNRGEVLGLIGESGAGKSTIGIATMGYTRPGCRIVGGSIDFDVVPILTQTVEQIREVRGV